MTEDRRPAPVLSLSKARKAKARSERQTQAAANRAKFGQPRALREAGAAERSRQQRAHEAGTLNTPPAESVNPADTPAGGVTTRRSDD